MSGRPSPLSRDESPSTSVLGPSTPLARSLTFNLHDLIQRRSKRRVPKSSPATQCKGKKVQKRSIMKNLMVLAWNSDESLKKHFTTKDAECVVTGLIELELSGDESDAREEICAVLNNATSDQLDVSQYGPNDFEFVKRSGHSFRIPDRAPGFKFSTEALKTLVGQGDVYVRLTKEIRKSDDSWSDDPDFEKCPNPVKVKAELPVPSPPNTPSPVASGSSVAIGS